MDAEGYLLAKNGAESKHPGVFIAGDVADRVYKQAVTAAGMGCAAALEAEKYLSEAGQPLICNLRVAIVMTERSRRIS